MTTYKYELNKIFGIKDIKLMRKIINKFLEELNDDFDKEVELEQLSQSVNMVVTVELSEPLFEGDLITLADLIENFDPNAPKRRKLLPNFRNSSLARAGGLEIGELFRTGERVKQVVEED